jgi:hypothetical protein
MDTLELEVVKGGAVKVVEQVNDEVEVAKPIPVEESELETHELSIAELEAIFSELN